MTIYRRPAWLLVIVVAILATIVMTWPLSLSPGSGVQDHGDPLLQIWTLRWDLHQLARDPLHLYDANTFTPFPHPLAYSESMLATAVLFAPLYWLSGNDILAYNLLLLLTFAGSVITTSLLARELTGRTWAALAAGLAFAFIPYRFGHLSHLNLLSLQWLPLLLLCLLRFLRTAHLPWAAGFALAFLLQSLSSFYYAYLAAIASAVMLVTQPPWRDGRPTGRRLLGLAAAALVIGALLIPVSWPYFTVRQVMDFERTLEDAEELAASPRSYLSVAPASRLYERRLPQRYPNPLFPGGLVLILATIGLLAAGRREPRQWRAASPPPAPPLPLASMAPPGLRRTIWSVVAMGVVGLLLSFGPSLEVASWTLPMPYTLLYDYLPGAKGLRDVARFGVLTLLALALLTAAGLGWLADWLADRRVPLLGGPWSAHLLTGLAGLIILAEFANGSVRVVPVERDETALAAYRWLAAQPAGRVMEFPADGVVNGKSVTTTTRYMYYSTEHWQPLIQGYSGFVPQLHYEFLANFPDDRRSATPSHLNLDNVGLLRDLAVRYVLFHQERYSGGGWRLVQENLARIDGLTLVGRFGTTWVYTLASGDRHPVLAELLIPQRVIAGQPITLQFVLRNPNATSAAYGFGGKAELRLEWLTDQAVAVTSTTIAFLPGAVVAPGTRLRPIKAGLSPPPGTYRLRLSSADPRLQELLPAAPMPVVVQVAPPVDAPPAPAVGNAPSATAAPAARLKSLTWPNMTFRSGQPLPLAMTWASQGPLPGATIFCQLIGPDNQIVGQRDGDPLDGQHTLSRWLADDEIADRRDLPIAATAPAGRYRLLVGIYDRATGRRLPITGPDGNVTTEFWSGPIEIVAAQ